MIYIIGCSSVRVMSNSYTMEIMFVNMKGKIKDKIEKIKALTINCRRDKLLIRILGDRFRS